MTMIKFTIAPDRARVNEWLTEKNISPEQVIIIETLPSGSCCIWFR